MNRRSTLLAQFFCLLALALTRAQASAPPEDFPRFQVPGHEQEMATLRSLFWLHYPGSGPKATLWDEWLSLCSLWPAVGTNSLSDSMRSSWDQTLSGRIVDTDGYVATHQHASIAHQLGWPFPFYNQGRGGFGWHYSFKDTIGPGWRPNELNKPGGWTFEGAREAGLNEDGWKIELTAPHATAMPPALQVDPYNSPFVQLRWSATGLGRAQPFLEWTTDKHPDFSPERRVYFPAVDGPQIQYTMLPVWRHPQWTNQVTRLRLNFDNAQAGGSLVIQALFAQYDTRQNINSQNFVRGCATYFWWTRDLDFLRRNLNRMRTAIRYLMTEHQTLERKVVYTGWVGHDGRPGYHRNADGSIAHALGHGIGNNYWDILPFGNLDCYATVQYYDALQSMARIERDVLTHPAWQLPGGALALDPEFLTRHAAEVKAEGNRLFWNEAAGRFVACIDADGQSHDYGFTFLNNEAVYYGFATAEHTQAIMSWLNGDRVVEGDTAQREDIYHWRFAPRATTKRNLDWYLWVWERPETFPFGGQVQDGGAVLGFAYHDLMARIKTLGPDNAWKRLQETLRWFDEVQAAGGYRKYYDGKREGTLQGGGTAGGLGLEMEFFESALVPQVMLYGFLGFAPRADGFKLEPQLPAAWPELTMDRIRFQNLVLRIRAARDTIEIQREAPPAGALASSPASGLTQSPTTTADPLFLQLPPGRWKAMLLRQDGAPLREASLAKRPADGALELNWAEAAGVRLVTSNASVFRSSAERESFFRAQASKPGEFRATWVHSAYGIEGWSWDQTIATLKSNGFSAVIPNMLWGGVAHYPSKVLPTSERATERGDQIAECLQACRKYGLEMHVWKVCYNLLHAPPEFVAQLRTAGRTQKDVRGKDVNWLCPSHPDNFALERDALLEVARNYEVDGIHFDYIRYPDKNACFCDGCRERFEQAARVKLDQWPEDVLTGKHASPFADWRRDQITHLVREVSQQAHQLKPHLKVSAAVWGGWEGCRRSVGQDWKVWVDAGYLDFVCPMDYEGQDADFAHWVRSQVGWINHKTPLYAGIGAFKLSGPEQLVQQIQLSRELGADGFVLFNLTEKLATQMLPPLRLGATSTPPLARP